jgi:DNA-binding SARP family transcriptional activator/TolB-like protein
LTEGKLTGGNQLNLNNVNTLNGGRFRLLTLGRLTLLCPAGQEDAALGKQRRKLALLAVLALARRPLTRDALVEMFWGDQDEQRARHSLSEALSHLRRVLGRDAITARQAGVALAGELPLDVDAVELADRFEQRRYGDAAALYCGPFLDGVYVPGSTSFEHWADGQRARLESLFLQACERESALLAAAQRWPECAELASRWLDAAPLSDEAALALLTALDAPGTPEAARQTLSAYERLRVRLEREFGVAPGAEVIALSHRVAGRRVATEATTTSPPLEPASALATAAVSTATPNPRRSRRSRHHLGPVSTALLALLVTAAALLARGWSHETPTVSPSTVAVLPFAVSGGPAVEYLRQGMVDLLSTNLDGAGALRTVDPRAVIASTGGSKDVALDPELARAIARRFGAGLLVVGDVVAAGDRLRVSAALYDQRRRARPLGQAVVEGRPTELFTLVDRLAAQLLAAQPRGGADQLVRIAAVTTSSLPALKAYLDGEEEYRAGRYPAAFDAYQRAVGLDSAFALAHLRLSQAATWGAIWTWQQIIDASGRAVRHADRLGRRPRLLVEAFDDYNRGAYDDAERLYRTLIAAYPDDVEGWYQLGEVLFHCNPLRGRSFLESRGAFERVLALEPQHRGALIHLLRVASEEGRRAEVDTLLARATALTQDDGLLELRAFHAFAFGDRAEQDDAVAALREARDEVVHRSFDRIAVHAHDLAGAERIAALLADPSRPRDTRAMAHVWLAQLELAQGRWRSAETQLTAAEQLRSDLAHEHRALMLAAPFLVRPRNELEAARAAVAVLKAEPPTTDYVVLAPLNRLHRNLREYLMGVLSARMGEAGEAGRRAASLDSIARSGGTDSEARAFARGLASSVRGHAAMAQGKREEALAAFDRGRLTLVSEGLLLTAVGLQTLERYQRGELLRKMGREREALAWYAASGQTPTEQIAYLAPAQLRQAEIYERLGQREKAAEHYGKFVELWKDCDPELRPLMEEARRKVFALREATAN